MNKDKIPEKPEKEEISQFSKIINNLILSIIVLKYKISHKDHYR
jgi:hypothetical protein